MAASVPEAPATYSQPSRKGKRAWRKNVDLREVQAGLDTVREEIAQVGGVIAEQASAQLFTADLQGDAALERGHRAPQRLLKVDEILNRRSAVPAVGGRKRKAAATAPPDPTGKKARNGAYISHRELQRLRQVADYIDHGKLDDAAATEDLWREADEEDPAVPEHRSHANRDFLPPPERAREPKTLKHAPAALTASGRPLAHVRKPDAGKSYNPLVGDWAALLEREGAAAVQAETARLQAEREAVARQERAEEEARIVEAAEREEYATDYDSTWDSEWDGIRSEAEDRVHTAKPQRRKTPAERNKIKARKEREAREKWERKQKERDAQEKRISQIAREASATHRQRQVSGDSMNRPALQDSSDSDENQGEVQLQRRRFGKLPVPQAHLEVTLPEDLQDSLRRLKPEGNLLADRYRNLLVNGKLEVRRRVGDKKKAKTFKTEKWSYKDWTLK